MTHRCVMFRMIQNVKMTRGIQQSIDVYDWMTPCDSSPNTDTECRNLRSVDYSWRPPEPEPGLILIAAWSLSLTRRHYNQLTINSFDCSTDLQDRLVPTFLQAYSQFEDKTFRECSSKIIFLKKSIEIRNKQWSRL